MIVSQTKYNNQVFESDDHNFEKKRSETIEHVITRLTF